MIYPFKICDPVHGFIRFGMREKRVIDSSAFQRLRYIQQMGMASLVYPGAHHSRFEHSLGVMELATRIYNTLMAPHNWIVPCSFSSEEIDYWREILRLAALCHDMGHLPFSHTAERVLLMDGGHERMTEEIIHSLGSIWQEIGPHAEQDILKLAVNHSEASLTIWERVFAQIITEDNFGADRIDYLIRDGHYTGVGYGQFDYHQLIDTLRILPKEENLSLGITASGMQSVESLWIARYMMYARVYHHPKCHVYCNHLKRFMSNHYKQGIPLSPLSQYLDQTDPIILQAIFNRAKEGDYDALTLLKKEKPFVELTLNQMPDLSALKKHFQEDILIDSIPQKTSNRIFPVLDEKTGLIHSSKEISPFLYTIPAGEKPLQVYAHPQKIADIQTWLHKSATSMMR